MKSRTAPRDTGFQPLRHASTRAHAARPLRSDTGFQPVRSAPHGQDARVTVIPFLRIKEPLALVLFLSALVLLSPFAIAADVQIGPGGELIIGGFDPSKPADADRLTKQLDEALPKLKSLGVTSHESYVRWNLCEPSEGQFDFAIYDKFVAVYKKHGFKWVPFIICGSPYSLPDWYYKKPGSQGYVCLEHNQESDVQSLWNPKMRDNVSHFLKAFCEHYRDSGVIESVLLGVTGNYGEAIYPATGNDWTADVHGKYHSHPGFWAGDPFAVKSFQEFVKKKYADNDKLITAWNSKTVDIANIKPFLQKDAPNDRAWLDMVDWYTASMTDYARFWLKETRKHFGGEIYLCTGGHAPPQHGADFGEQCRIAAEVKGGVRITNEASDQAGNFTLTRWVASAGKQYGAYYSFEPAGGVTPAGVIARIYNATASGAHGLHYYYPNLMDNKQATANWEKFGDQFKQRKPIVEIAVFYPSTDIKLHGQDFLDKIKPLRDRFDFDYMSEKQIADGGLKRIKVLILLHGNVAEAGTWRIVADWIKAGGMLVYAEGTGRLRTVEGDESVHEQVIGAIGGLGRVLVFPGPGDSTRFRDYLTEVLPKAKELSSGTMQMIRAAGKEDGVFATLCEGNEILWLNTNNREIKIDDLTLPPDSIVSQSIK